MWLPEVGDFSFITVGGFWIDKHTSCVYYNRDLLLNSSARSITFHTGTPSL